MMKNIKFLFSDIGGVFLSNGWDHISRKEASRIFGFDYEEMNLRHNFIFDTYEIGKIPLDAYLDTAIFYKRRGFDKKEFIEFMFSRSVQLPQMLDYMIDWKKEHPEVKIISINNEPRDLNQYRIQKFQLHRVFDAFISSCEVGMRKPDPGIFKLATGIAQSNSSECLYFDDREMMVRSAIFTGINAHLHESFEKSKEILEEWVKG